MQTPSKIFMLPRMTNNQMEDVKVKFTPTEGTRKVKIVRRGGSSLKNTKEDKNVSLLRKRFLDINMKLETIAMREENSRHFY